MHISFRFTALIYFIIFTISSGTSANSYAQKRTYTILKVNGTGPVIDGKLDDAIWQNGRWEGAFTQNRPYNGDPPTYQTRFKAAYDKDHIYFAIQALDDEPEKIEKRLGRRDQLVGDWIQVAMDTYFDKRTAFMFGVNAAGVIRDGVQTGDGQAWNGNWDPVWFSKVLHDDSGWSVEIKIPFHQLRFSGGENLIWGLDVHRSVHRNEEFSQWQLIKNGVEGWPSHFGELHGIQDLDTKMNIEIAPYSVGKVQSTLAELGNPFTDGLESTVSGGFDAKVGVTSDLTLDIAVNPDFGQVEADPSEVNLTAFETFFPEKRTFFTEGNNILDFQVRWGGRLFHSRRIGRRPSYFPSTKEGEFSDVPDNTSILAAAKLTGKTKKGYSIGILESITQNEKADLLSDGVSREVDSEPLTNYFVGRIQKDYDAGNTLVGAMLTSTNRNIKSAHLNFLHDAAYTGGVDFIRRWKNKTYNFLGRGVFSYVKGSTEAISQTQRSSARYFQRVDQDYLDFDPARTSLAGHGGDIIFQYTGNGNWYYGLWFLWKSPGLEVNDLGFLSSTDWIQPSFDVQYEILNPAGIFNKFSVYYWHWRDFNFNKDATDIGHLVNINTQFKNFWRWDTNVQANLERLDTRLLRGGPMFLTPTKLWILNKITSDSRKNMVANVQVHNNFGKEGYLRTGSYSAGLKWRMSSSKEISLDPSFNTNKNDLQYITTVDFDGQHRYLLGKLDQKTFALTTRFNYSLTPNLSIQYYGQPFFSSGSYSDFKFATNTQSDDYDGRFRLYAENELALDTDEGSYAVDENGDGNADYSFGKPDFDFFQFRSNLVIRWEYNPGSTLFLVWNQERTGSNSIGDFSFNENFSNVFSQHPDNVFLIKLSKWFSF